VTEFQPPTQSELLGPPPALVAHGRTMTGGYLTEQSQAERVSSAREMWTRGILDPAAPGVVYWPSLSEISRMTELTKTTLERHRNADGWDEQRDSNMAALNVSHMTSLEVSEAAVERAERMQANMQKLDDRAFELSQQGMAVAGGMLTEMVESGDGNAGKLHKIASSLEVFHKIAKAAYSPANVDSAGQTINNLNVSLNTVTASEEIVSAVAKVYMDLEEKARAKTDRRHNVIEGEVTL
jgi:hypothetical protein